MHLFATALLLAGLSITASPAPAESLDQILACNAEALGGGAAFEAIGNVRIRLDIAEPGFAVRGTYVASRDGLMRIDIEADGQRVFAEGLDGERAWQWSPDSGVHDSGAAGAAALRNGIESPGRFWTLQQLRARGAQLALLDPGPLAGENEWQVRQTRADGTLIDYLLDRQSCLPTRDISRRAFHPDADAAEVLIETTYSDPERREGVLHFRRQDQKAMDTGDWLGTTKVVDYEQNVDLPQGFFAAQ